MSNSQGQRREIIRLADFPRSITPEPARRVETAESTRVIDSSERLSDPLEDRSEEEVETFEPAAGVMDSSARSSDPLGHQTATPGRDPEDAAIEDDTSERSSQPEDSPLMAASWILPEVTTSTNVDTGAMPTTDLEQAAWELQSCGIRNW